MLQCRCLHLFTEKACMTSIWRNDYLPWFSLVRRNHWWMLWFQCLFVKVRVQKSPQPFSSSSMVIKRPFIIICTDQTTLLPCCQQTVVKWVAKSRVHLMQHKVNMRSWWARMRKSFPDGYFVTKMNIYVFTNCHHCCGTDHDNLAKKWILLPNIENSVP